MTGEWHLGAGDREWANVFQDQAADRSWLQGEAPDGAGAGLGEGEQLNREGRQLVGLGQAQVVGAITSQAEGTAA